MDEEQAPLLPRQEGEDGGETRRPPASKKKKALICVVALFMLDFIVCCITLTATYLWKHNRQLKYPGESITWAPCGEVVGRPVECSSVDVPMDHFGNSSSNNTFNIPLIRRRGGPDAKTNLILQPGGPGESGLKWMRKSGGYSHKIVGEDQFHLIAFDPRGIAGSRPRALCFAEDDDEHRNALTPATTGNLHEDEKNWVDWGNLMRACGEYMGEYAPHINTPQTAADMNDILDAVGQKDMYYWGSSYATTLGQTYATMFQDRAERVVVDAVQDHAAWYEDVVDTSSYQETAKGVSGFFDECAKAGDACPLHALGTSGYEMEREVMGFVETLKDEPVPVYINGTSFGSVTYETMIIALYTAPFSPAYFYPLARGIAQLMQGNGTAIFQAYGGVRQHVAHNSESPRFVINNDLPTGPEHWPATRAAAVEQILRSTGRYLPFSTISFAETLGQAQWPVPQAYDFRGVPARIETKNPLLLVSMSVDPICPLAGAKEAQRRFVGARLVEIEAYGHCSDVAPSPCAAKVVRAFLREGRLPEEEHTKCPALVTYFPRNGEGEAHEAEAEGMGEEDEELVAALRDLAAAANSMPMRLPVF